MPGETGLFPTGAARTLREVVAASPPLREHLDRIDVAIRAVEGMLGGYSDLGCAQQVWADVLGQLQEARIQVGSGVSAAEPGWRGEAHRAYLDYRSGALRRMGEMEQTLVRLTAVVDETRCGLAAQYRVAAAALVRAACGLVVLATGSGRIEGAAVGPALATLRELVEQVALALPPVDAALTAGRASLVEISGTAADLVVPPAPPETAPPAAASGAGPDPAVA